MPKGKHKLTKKKIYRIDVTNHCVEKRAEYFKKNVSRTCFFLYFKINKSITDFVLEG